MFKLLLQTLDARISKTTALTPIDFVWTKHLELKPEELHSRYAMFITISSATEGKLRWERMDDFLTARDAEYQDLVRRRLHWAGSIGSVLSVSSCSWHSIWYWRRCSELAFEFMAVPS